MAPVKSLTSSSCKDNPGPFKGNLKHRPSVSLHVGTLARGSSAHDQPVDQENEYHENEEDHTGENMIDMLNILKEHQKKKCSRSCSRVTAIARRKSAIKELRDAEIHQMKQEGTAYIAQIHANVNGLREQEVPPDCMFVDVAALFATQMKGAESQLDILSYFLFEISPARLKLIEKNSADVRSHSAQFEKAGRKVKKKAKKELQSGLEEQKLATKTQAYLKHFKHLVQL